MIMLINRGHSGRNYLKLGKVKNNFGWSQRKFCQVGKVDKTISPIMVVERSERWLAWSYSCLLLALRVANWLTLINTLAKLKIFICGISMALVNNKFLVEGSHLQCCFSPGFLKLLLSLCVYVCLPPGY